MTTYKVTAIGFRGYAQGEEFEADDMTEEEEADYIKRGWIKRTTKKEEESADG